MKATFGHQSVGFSPSKLAVICSQSASAVMTPRLGRCQYSTLCLALGPEGHPKYRMLREVFVMWFKVMSEPLTNPLMVHRDKLRTAWIALRNKMLDACVGFRLNIGPEYYFRLPMGLWAKLL